MNNYVKTLSLIKDEIFYLGVENEASIGILGEVYEKQLSESKSRIKLSYNNARRNWFILERMKSNVHIIQNCSEYEMSTF